MRLVLSHVTTLYSNQDWLLVPIKPVSSSYYGWRSTFYVMALFCPLNHMSACQLELALSKRNFRIVLFRYHPHFFPNVCSRQNSSTSFPTPVLSLKLFRSFSTHFKSYLLKKPSSIISFFLSLFSSWFPFVRYVCPWIYILKFPPNYKIYALCKNII